MKSSLSRRRFFRTAAFYSASLAVGSRLFGQTAKLSSKLNLLSFLPDQLSMNPTSYYTRLFVGRPGSTLDSPLEKGLEELGRKMTDDNDPKTDGVANAGYTYMGQFIDHDLTLDLTPLDQATSEMDRTPNFRTPFLDLDQLYGGGPNLSPFLYDRRAKRGEEHFLIGGTKASKLGDKDFPSSLDDLPRNSQGIALAGDPRQDENLILAQLHVAFLKLHNKTIAQPGLLAASPYYRKGQAGKDDLTDFEAARRVVMWHYQWIVRHDYLKKIIDPDIFSHLEEIHPRPKDRSKPFQIPVEFSVAAFRFGHSMVRDSYIYNEQHEDVDLLCLLELTGTGIKAPCKDVSRGKDVPFSLPADWVIDWRHFFLLGSSPLRHIVNSRKIDTKIANGLHGLPPHTANLFSVSVPGKPPEEHPLPVKTL